MRRLLSILFIALVGSVGPVAADNPEPSLRGSEESMERQNGIAHKLGLRFVRTSAEFPRLLGEGELVALSGNDDYEILDRVAYPYARPEVRTFIENLAADYRKSTGEVLVVTSLTRPSTRQPRNSHHLSVHPTGIAIDLRVSSRRTSRRWLERTLLEMERKALLDVTLERNPPHFHVALFPDAFAAHTGELPAPAASDPPKGVHRLILPDGVAISASPSSASAMAILGDTGGEWMPLIAVFPLLGILLGVFGLRRKTHSIVPEYQPFKVPYIDPRDQRDPRDLRASAQKPGYAPEYPAWSPVARHISPNAESHPYITVAPQYHYPAHRHVALDEPVWHH